MIEATLISFIAAELKAGTPSDRIRQKLLGAGWPAGKIDSVWRGLGQIDTATPPRPPRWHRRASQAVQARRVHWRLWAFLLMLGGFSYGGYYWHYVSAPTRLVNQMLAHVSAVQSLSYAADIRLEMQPEVVLDLMIDKDSLAADNDVAEVFGWPVRVAISGNGALDWHDPDRVTSTLNAGFRVVKPLPTEQVAIEYRSVGRERYFRLKPPGGTAATTVDSTRPDAGSVDGVAAPPYAALVGKWVRYSFATAQRQWSDSWLMDLANRPDFTLAFGAMLRELPGSGALTSLNRLGLSEVEGQLVWRLQPILDNERFRHQLAEALGPDLVEASYLDSLEISDMELWIGQESRLPHRLSFDLAGGQGTSRAQVSVTLLFSDYDQRLTVELPDSAISFTEALAGWQ